jgi:hypothetical protein
LDGHQWKWLHGLFLSYGVGALKKLNARIVKFQVEISWLVKYDRAWQTTVQTHAWLVPFVTAKASYRQKNDGVVGNKPISPAAQKVRARTLSWLSCDSIVLPRFNRISQCYSQYFLGILFIFTLFQLSFDLHYHGASIQKVMPLIEWTRTIVPDGALIRREQTARNAVIAQGNSPGGIKVFRS